MGPALPSPSETNPFLRVRFRTLVPIALLTGIATVALAAALADVPPFDDDTGQVMAVMFLMYGTLALWCLWESFRNGIPLALLFRMPPPGYPWLRTCALVIPALCANFGLMLVLFAAMTFVAPELMVHYFNSASDVFEGAETTRPVVYFAVLAFSLIVVAPFVEELFFRGFLISMWRPRRGARKSVILSAVTFALAHVVQPGSIFLGLVAGVYYVETTSLIIPMLLHLLNNLLAFGIPNLLSLLLGPSETPTIAEIRLGASVAGIPLLLFGLVWLTAFFVRHFPRLNAAPMQDKTTNCAPAP